MAAEQSPVRPDPITTTFFPGLDWPNPFPSSGLKIEENRTEKKAKEDFFINERRFQVISDRFIMRLLDPYSIHNQIKIYNNQQNFEEG